MADGVLDPHFEVSEDEVRERMFSNIESIWPNPEYRPDFREGGLSWSMVSPASKEVADIYLGMNEMLNISFLQYTYGEYLDAKGLEIGLDRIAATPGQGIVRFLGENGTIIPAGTTVSTTAEDTGDVAYQIDTNTYEEDGVTPIPVADRTITGIEDPRALNAVQRLTMDPLPTQDGFTLTFTGTVDNPVAPETTATINYNDTAADVQNALEALPSVGVGNVEATGGMFPFADVLVEFKNDLGKQNVNLLTVTPVGGFDGTLTVTEEVRGTNGQPSVVISPGPNDGLVSGDAVWKYTWVTVLGDEREDTYQEGYGETAGGEQTDPVLTLSNQYATVTIEEVPAYTGLQEITKVRLYRNFNDGGGFSGFKFVAEAEVPEIPGPIVIVDNVPNVDFEIQDALLEDTNTTGVADIPATAVETGSATNIPVGAIALLDDPVFGVEAVTNPLPFSEGDDEETDDDYRARLLEEVRKPPGAGNVADYIGWAKEIAGVGGVTVAPEWEEQFGYPNGPGTVKVVLSGPNNEQVNYSLIEEVRSYIAGTVALDAPRDFVPFGVDYGMTYTVNAGGGNMDAGDYEYVFTFVNVGGGETPHSAANEDLSEDSSRVFGTITVANGDSVTLHDVPAGPSGVDVQNTIKRRVYRRDANGTDDHFYMVGEILGNVVEDFEDELAEADLALRYAPIVNSTSLFNGKAPIGAHVTVESISEFAVTVSATIIPDPGYNLLGTGGNINLGNLLRNALKTYFDDLAAGETVYYVDVQNVIHDCEGVLDFRDVVLETSAGTTTDNIIPPNANAKPVFNQTGVLTEAAI